MEYKQALRIAERVKAEFEPHCDRIEIAGSIRRKKPVVKDIEIVAIPKDYGVGLFESGVATVINQWKKIKGELPCKYTQRQHPDGIMLDIFFATPINWGYILAIRTGSAKYSHQVLAKSWVAMGYKGQGGNLTRRGQVVNVEEEKTLFALINIDYVEPQFREVIF